MLYAFEGIDGCGKTTIMKKVADTLKSLGYDVIEMYEPNGIYRRLLKDDNFDMTMAERFYTLMACRASNQNKIEDDWDKIILCDRYIESTYAYQPLEGISIDKIETCNRDFIKARLNFLLYTDITECMRRLEERGKDNDDMRQLGEYQVIFDNYMQRATDNDKFRLFLTDDIYLVTKITQQIIGCERVGGCNEVMNNRHEKYREENV